jgi:hypothetical protein
MPLRLAFVLAAALGLQACGAPSVWAPDDQVQAARFVSGEPPSITLYTVVNKRSGSGAHSALLVNGSERAMFDPAGSWHHPRLPERNDVHFGMTDRAIAFYIDYHARETYDVVEQRIPVSAEVAELALARIQANGPTPKSMCANHTSAVLRDLPGFQSIPQTWFPNQLSQAFGELPGATSRRITDDDDDSNHGVLIVQANGDPLEG